MAAVENKTIALVVNDYDQRALDAAQSLQQWCADNAVILQKSTHGLFDPLPVSPVGDVPYDLIVALGGDGTILRAVHEFATSGIPVLGAKFGRLGFLSGAPAEDLLTAVQSALSGTAAIERRALLKVTAWSGDSVLGTYYALNEAVIGRHTDSPVITSKLSINDHSVYQLRGDGLIVSTATGSTAYSLSAGGPILSPESRAMALVPLASHTLINRSIVTAPKDKVRIDLLDCDHTAATLSIDGKVFINNMQLERSIPHIQQMLTHIDAEISSQRWVSLVKTSTRLFFDNLATEFYRYED